MQRKVIAMAVILIIFILATMRRRKNMADRKEKYGFMRCDK